MNHRHPLIPKPQTLSHNSLLVFGFLLCLNWMTLSVHAGAWTQKKGQVLSISSYSYYETSETFDEDGDLYALSNDGSFTKQSFNEYLEYGITDSLTATGNFFYDLVEFENNSGSDTNSGFSDQEVGLRYRVFNEGPTVSLQGTLKFPMYSLSRTPILGNNQIDLEQRMLIGNSYKAFARSAFWNIELGYRARFDGPADQLRFQLLHGIDLFSQLQGIIQLDGTHSVGGSTPQNLGNNVTVNTDYSLLRGSLTLIYRITETSGVHLCVFRHLTGRNTGQGNGVEVGFRNQF
jgi:hypothetical protein